MILIAQVELLTKLVEHGIVAAAFLYILYWLLNKQSRMAEEQAAYARINNIEVANAIRSLTSVVMGMQQLLLTHDLTVHGLNPSTGETFEERDSLAHKKYSDIMISIEEQRDLLHRVNQEADKRIRELQRS